MRNRFDSQLQQLNKMLIHMGELCSIAIENATKALQDGNIDMANEVMLADAEIDHEEREIERLCLTLLLQQQPVARDLRQISAALKMITDMERIGDQAEDIAEIVTYLKGRTTDHMTMIEEMAKEAVGMVTSSVDSYVKKDVLLARQVINHDDVVDDYFSKVKNGIISLIRKNPEESELALDLLMIAKYFERIGDHATNIADWVVYSVTGKHEEE